MQVVFYGRLAEAIAPAIELDATCSVAELRRKLAAEHPQVASTLGSSRSRALVGALLVGEDYVIAGDDQVEFLPPVSGG